MRSASATSSFSSPLRSRPNRIADVLAGGDPRRHSARRLPAADHRLGLVMRARGVASTKRAVGDRGLEAVVEHGVSRMRSAPAAISAPSRSASLAAASPGAAATARNWPWRARPRRCSRRAAARPGRRSAPALDPALGLVGSGAGHGVRAVSGFSTSAVCATASKSEPPRIGTAFGGARECVEHVPRRFAALRAALDAACLPAAGAIGRRAAPGLVPSAFHRDFRAQRLYPQWRRSRSPIRSSRSTATR